MLFRSNTIASGEHRLITFKGCDGGHKITVTSEGSYTGAPATISLTFVIHRAAAPATFRVNGRNIKPKYNADAHTLTFSLRWPVDRPLNLESSNLTLCSQE